MTIDTFFCGVNGGPEGFLVKKEHLLSEKTSTANHIIWGQGSFNDTQPVYHRLLQYIKEHGLTITGNAYEERLIDEVGAFDKEQHIIQVTL